jgi:hypothetical protein
MPLILSFDPNLRRSTMVMMQPHPRASAGVSGALLFTFATGASAGWIQDTTYSDLWVGDGTHSGLVYDAAQELTWLQDANLFKTQSAGGNTAVRDAIIGDIGSITHAGGTHTLIASDFDINDGDMTWWGAMAWAQWLDYGGWDDWRLWSVTDLGNDGCDYSDDGTDCGYNIDTTTSELGHLWYDTLGNLAYYDTSGSAPQSGWGLTNTGPFQNFDDGLYWSGTEFAPNSGYAWLFSALSGGQNRNDKDFQFQAWAVRPGQVDVAALDAQPVPTPGTLWLVGAGILGLSLRRRRWALRRFV